MDQNWSPFDSPPGYEVELRRDGCIYVPRLGEAFQQEDGIDATDRRRILRVTKQEGPGTELTVSLTSNGKVYVETFVFTEMSAQQPRWHRRIKLEDKGKSAIAEPGRPRWFVDTAARLTRRISQHGEYIFSGFFLLFLLWYALALHGLFKSEAPDYSSSGTPSSRPPLAPEEPTLNPNSPPVGHGHVINGDR